MRTIGIDLAIKANHLAVIVGEDGRAIGSPFSFRTDPLELEQLLRRARQGAADTEPLRVVMEPTGSMWLPVAAYLVQRGVTVYMVNTQQVAELRKIYSKHAKSDRISARVLASLPWVNPDALHPLSLAQADYLSGQRWCRQQEELAELIAAIKNRVQAWERAFWPGLEEVVDDLFAPWLRQWREWQYDPWRLQQGDVAELIGQLIEAGAPAEEAPTIARGIKAVAGRAVGLFGSPEGGACRYVHYAALQEQVLRELRLLGYYEAEHHAVRHQVQQTYRRLDPTRRLESLKGVGEDGAAVYTLFIGDESRFATQKEFRGWSGMVPESDQSGNLEKKGLKISGAGPDLIKKYAYINAEVARQWDPQLAAIYYDQMVYKGKHHIQAVCHCATHLLDRVRAVLRDGRAYELRDVDGKRVTWEEARRIIAERYQVPQEVRKRRRQQARKDRRDRRAERGQGKGSRPVRQEAGVYAPPH